MDEKWSLPLSSFPITAWAARETDIFVGIEDESVFRRQFSDSALLFRDHQEWGLQVRLALCSQVVIRHLAPKNERDALLSMISRPHTKIPLRSSWHKFHILLLFSDVENDQIEAWYGEWISLVFTSL